MKIKGELKKMKISHLFIAICTCMFITLTISSAHAAVLTFDDISPSGTDIPSGYGSFNWSNMYIHSGTTGASGYNNGRVSGTNVAYNGGGNPSAITTTSGTFNFNGTYLTGALKDQLNINVKGYSGLNLLYDTTVVVSAYSPTWFQFDYFGVDKLEFSSSGGVLAGFPGSGPGTQFAMDNFTINAVPVPTAIWLFGSGLIGLIGFARRKKA